MHNISELVTKSNEIVGHIIMTLTEFYHQASILTYLDNMESVDYKEKTDKPEELQGHLEIAKFMLKELQKGSINLLGLYKSYNQTLNTSEVLEVSNELLRVLEGVTTYLQRDKLINGIIDSYLMTQADKLREEVVNLIKQTSIAASNILPIDLQSESLKGFSYSDIQRNPQATSQLAFTLFETHLRNKINANAELYGENLINAVYGNNGQLKYGATPSEQLGVRNLISGVYAVFRNPRMHRIIQNDNKNDVMTLIALVDLLIRIVDASENSNPS